MLSTEKQNCSHFTHKQPRWKKLEHQLRSTGVSECGWQKEHLQSCLVALGDYWHRTSEFTKKKKNHNTEAERKMPKWHSFRQIQCCENYNP